MRPGQNKRMRGRNNRKGPNPLTRTYESNGPDVKIRGTAHHVAEKYLQLARDAQSSGDPVMAESYLQHAEHYFRIIAAAQLAQQQAQVGYARQPGELDADEGDDDDDMIPDRFASPLERAPQVGGFGSPPPLGPQPQPVYAPPPGQPQPFIDRPQPFASEKPQGQPRPDRNGYQDRNDRNGNRFGQNRPPRDRDQRPPRDFAQPPRDARVENPRVEARPVEFDEQPTLPAFITGPTRANQDQPPGPVEADREAPSSAVEQEEASFHLRPRRRRRPRAENGESEGGAPQAPVGDLSFGD
jgi:hypothetical protein